MDMRVYKQAKSQMPHVTLLCNISDSYQLFAHYCPEFVVGLLLLLRVTFFPLSIVHLPSSVGFGEHLLGCSHDPMRIHHHDTLVISPFQDHPGVLKGQRALYNDELRHCDIFDLHFQHGHSAFFDVSVALFSLPLFPPLLRVLG